MKNYKQLFILGNPRSGTSLLRIMLNCHSKIAIPPECGFMIWWYDKYKNWAYENDNDLAILDDIFASKKFETWNLNKSEVVKNIIEFKPKNYTELCSVIYLTYALKFSKSIETIGDKNNYYIKHIPILNKLYPNAKYIHIIRDVRDVACSYLNIEKLETDSLYKPILSSDVDEIATEWERNNLTTLNFFTTINEQNYITIKYEDLILNNKTIIKQLCDFLDIEVENAMFNYFDENKKFGVEPKETLDWKKKTLEPLDYNNIAKYKRELSAEQIEKINNKTKQLRKKFNYD